MTGADGGVSTIRSAAKAADESTAVAAVASKASLRERIVYSFVCLESEPAWEPPFPRTPI
jgi:hypothetical protein